MNFSIVIPARYASARLPGKPLQTIAGKPMIRWVYERACKSAADRVIVATDDVRVQETVADFGGEVLMTSPNHPSGTDRLQEVASRCNFRDEDILVNVQGDEPLIPPSVINQVAANLANNTDARVATLSEPIGLSDDFVSPNVVKVVTDKAGFALYFSRAPIPWPRDHFHAGIRELPDGFKPQRHIGIYAYRVGLLNRFVTWSPVLPERLEHLEQLRFLWHGECIHVAEAVEKVPGGVDTEQDLQRVTDWINRRGDHG